MSERYFITGVQLGMLKHSLETPADVVGKINADKILSDIEEKQFIGNIPLHYPHESYEIVIVKKDKRDKSE